MFRHFILFSKKYQVTTVTTISCQLNDIQSILFVINLFYSIVNNFLYKCNKSFECLNQHKCIEGTH